MARLCERPGCSEHGAIAYGFDAGERRVWLAPLDPDADRNRSGTLCVRHADAMVVPQGWTLEDARDPFRFRAGELLFREQRVTLRDGQVMLADEETVSMLSRSGGFGSLGRLLVEAETAPMQIELDVLVPDNAEAYFARADRFDTVLDLGFTRPGLDALCRVLEVWTRRLLGVGVRIQPVAEIRDERWVWHIGLDADASRLLNNLWQGETLDEDDRRRLLALFRLEVEDLDLMLERVRGRPVYLALAMTEDGRLKLKPQNLLLNLPLRAAV